MKTINLKDYEITLLTKEEYERYKERIPLVRDVWWLRSPGHYDDRASIVLDDGYVNINGYSVDYFLVAVRPALKSELLTLPIGTAFIALGNRWIVVDDGVAISQDVITHRRYDAESNNWETSELREWLIEWAKEGEDDDV